MERTRQRPVTWALNDSGSASRGLGRQRLLRMRIVFGLILIKSSGLANVGLAAIGLRGKCCDGTFTDANIFANTDFDALIGK